PCVLGGVPQAVVSQASTRQKGDRLLVHLMRLGRPARHQEHRCKIAVRDSGRIAEAVFLEDPQCLAEFIEAAEITELATCATVKLEDRSTFHRGFELVGERESAFGAFQRFARFAADGSPTCMSPIRLQQLAARRMTLEDANSFIQLSHRLIRLPEQPLEAGHLSKRIAQTDFVVRCTEQFDRLLVFFNTVRERIDEVGVEAKKTRALDAARCQLEGASVVALAFLSIERSRALAGKRKETTGRVFERFGFARLTGCACKVERLLVVIGE